MSINIDIDASKMFDDFKEQIDDIERLYNLVPFYNKSHADLVMASIRKRMLSWISLRREED